MTIVFLLTLVFGGMNYEPFPKGGGKIMFQGPPEREKRICTGRFCSPLKTAKK